MPIEIVFRKTGKETKAAIQKRREQLQQRLSARNQALDVFMQNPPKVRSYLVRATQPVFGHGQRAATLYGKDEISSEERQEVEQLCRRIYELEQELHRLHLIAMHLKDDQELELRFDDLIAYGFDTSIESE